MGDRRVRRTVYTARGRMELTRARYTFSRVSIMLNENKPPYEDHRLDFYNAVNARITARRDQEVTVAP